MATSPNNLHTSLLRPAVIHMIRAAGFHSARPSVIDTLTDLCARHLLLLASNTASNLYERTTTTVSTTPFSPSSPPSTTPPAAPEEDTTTSPSLQINDIRLALSTASFFTSTHTPTEEAWLESLRRPLSTYRPGAREKERRRRDLEDTRDVRGFVDWCLGPVNAEVRRVAGVAPEVVDTITAGGVGGVGGVGGEAAMKEDYLTLLKRKHSKTGDGARYAGTVLGRGGEEKGVLRIEGGPPSLEAWGVEVGRRIAGSGEEAQRAVGSGEEGTRTPTTNETDKGTAAKKARLAA
ncbi:MAG: hypothetical protein M1828_005005 [Chrysothrix sp. TS-e1954]|nr:MAG: hypothetical protein M1828_005005 [Chrysothrix sp. TS-e1954]